MVYYSADVIPEWRLAALLSFKLKREYSEMCGFVKARISLVIVSFNSLLFRYPWDKDEGI